METSRWQEKAGGTDPAKTYSQTRHAKSLQRSGTISRHAMKRRVSNKSDKVVLPSYTAEQCGDNGAAFPPNMFAYLGKTSALAS
jgi:hypothetical protein